MPNDHASLKWIPAAHGLRKATGPGGVIYTLKPCTIAADVLRERIAAIAGPWWFARRQEIELNDEPVSMADAIELCEQDAARLAGPGDTERDTFCTDEAIAVPGLPELTGEISGKLHRGASPLPADFYDNDHDGLG